jgi:CheY-like chemotaxis protein
MGEQKSDHANPNASQNKKLQILVAEDNLINQKIIEINITKLGHKIDFAENGQIAVEKFISNDYDVIFMDLLMPLLDGIEATKRIRQIERSIPNCNPVRIIGMTASAMPEDRNILIEAGMDDHIAKPFNRDDLSNILLGV